MLAQGRITSFGIRSGLAVLSAVLCAACTATVPVMGSSVASIQIESGDHQSAAAGTALALPLVVVVTGSNNAPVSGVAVTFAIASGGGSLDVTSAITDGTGHAQSALTLGPTGG